MYKFSWYTEKRSNEFNLIHSELPSMLSNISKKLKLEKFIHISH